MNKRDWLILAMSVCWGNFWWTLGFLLYNITGIWQFLVLFVMGFLGFLKTPLIILIIFIRHVSLLRSFWFHTIPCMLPFYLFEVILS